jgi:hypothetical protein
MRHRQHVLHSLRKWTEARDVTEITSFSVPTRVFLQRQETLHDAGERVLLAMDVQLGEHAIEAERRNMSVCWK